MATETELKLALPAAAVPALLAHPLFATTPPQRARLANTYFDTPDLALLARRFAVRLRRIGQRRLVTVKGEARAPGGLSRRAEWEAEVPGDTLTAASFAHVDDPDLRAELTALQPILAPVFTTDFQRRTWRVRHGDSRIEVAFDRGAILAVPAGTPSDRPRREAICELELELLEGQDDDLLALAEVLAETLPLLPAPASKAERAYRLYRQEAPTPLKVRLNGAPLPLEPRQAFQNHALICLETFNRNAAGFLATPGKPATAHPDPEFLHQARVALRRLRAALRLFANALPADYAARWKPALAELANALGPARDWQVLNHDTLPRIAGEAPPPLAPAQLAQLARRLVRAERRALEAARLALTDPATTRLTLSLLRTTLALPEAASANLPDLARQALRRDVKQLRRRLALLGDDPAEANASAWHRLRIVLKHLRYDLELMRPLLREADDQRWSRHLPPLQDALGMLNDGSVGIAHLQAIASPTLAAPAIAWLHGRGSGLRQTLPALLAPLASLRPPRLKKSP